MSTDATAVTPLSATLGRYYENLKATGMPEALVEQIVMDAAKRLHEWELCGGSPG